MSSPTPVNEVDNSRSCSSGDSTVNSTVTSSNSIISIRPAVLPDIARIARVAVESLPDDPTFDYLWSYRHEYPEDNYFFWLQNLKAFLFNPRFTLLVAVLHNYSSSESLLPIGEKPTPSPPPGPVETIIAFGLWERNGRSKAARMRYRGRNTFLNRLHRMLTRIETWSLSRQHPRRDVNGPHLSAFSAVMDAVHAEFWTRKHPENFHLDLLCTLPEYRCRGAGTQLTAWGIDAARAEGAVAGVEASPMGLDLYKRLGFALVGKRTVTVDGEEETLLVRVMVCVPGPPDSGGAGTI